MTFEDWFQFAINNYFQEEIDNSSSLGILNNNYEIDSLLDNQEENNNNKVSKEIQSYDYKIFHIDELNEIQSKFSNKFPFFQFNKRLFNSSLNFNHIDEQQNQKISCDFGKFNNISIISFYYVFTF